MEKKDLWNLGLLGVKAWDADREEPGPRQGGTRRIQSSGERGPDVGPERLLVKALHPKGPARAAGLALGDVIVGVNGKPFRDGSLDPLADALMAAESGRNKGRVELVVERTTQGKPEKLDIDCKIERGVKGKTDPFDDKVAKDITSAACTFLAEKQQSDGGFPQTLGGQNGAIVQTSLAGLAWLASGDARFGPQIAKASEFVTSHLGKQDALSAALGGSGSNWDQTTWGYSHAGMFLGQLALTRNDKSLLPKLKEIAKVLQERQEASGGFAHGPGGVNALGYLELNILGGYVLLALSVLEQAGCEVDAKIVGKLAAYLEASGSSDGGVGYSTAPGQKGSGNIGRTAVAWMGMEGLGRGREPWCQKMRNYVTKNAHQYLEGHASLMQHIMLGGMAAQALQGSAWKTYERSLARDLVLARAPDGSMQPRPWHESLLMESNSDVSMGEVWTTASWAIVVAAQGFGKKGGLPHVLGID